VVQAIGVDWNGAMKGGVGSCASREAINRIGPADRQPRVSRFATCTDEPRSSHPCIPPSIRIAVFECSPAV